MAARRGWSANFGALQLPPLDHPAFVEFLGFLEVSAQRHPERLGNVLDLTDQDADLVEGVTMDE